MKIRLSMLLVLVLSSAAFCVQSVTEPAREIPVAYDVDVVVVGGSTYAVAAAVEAAKKGATVFLAAERPYLGVDLCGTYRMWLEEGEVPRSELEKAIFSRQQAAAPIKGGARFTYKADVKSSAKHRDSGRMLTDGKCSAANTQSVQYDEDVTIIADLGKPAEVKKVHVLVYQRPGEFVVKSVTASTSSDRKAWSKPVVVPNKDTGRSAETDAIDIACDLGRKARYVKLAIAKADNAQRVLIGEVIIESDKVEKGGDDPSGASVLLPPPTPMHVKLQLDKALLDAGVKFLYSCYVTDLLVDGKGQPAGVVMTNRAGRQAVKADVVIDATERANIVRMTGAKFTAWKGGSCTFRRVVAGGTGGKGAKKLPVTYTDRGKAISVHEYTLSLPLRDSSWASFSEADHVARDRTWQNGQVFASEVMYTVPPDPMEARAADGPDNLDCFRPKGVDNIYALNACAGVPRDTVEKMLRTLAMMQVGTTIGAAAAKDAAAAKPRSKVTVAGAKPAGPAAFEVGEFLDGVRPSQKGKLATVASPNRALPILGRFDVVVIGGGTSGAPAGIASARRGANTLVVEYLYGLGGVGTVGRIGKYCHGYRRGFTAEMDKALGSKGTWDIQEKMEWYRRELRKAGATVWLRSIGCGALVKDNRVAGVVVATPFGRGAVLCKVVVDATGNADIAAAAGAECVYTSGRHMGVQGTGLGPRLPGTAYTNTDWTFGDETDMIDVWRMYVVAKNKYPGVFDLAQMINTRERRTIVGLYELSPLDIVNQRTFPDSVVFANGGSLDSHGFTVHPFFKFKTVKVGKVYVPYRCLIPKELDGLIAAGLGASAHRDAVAVIRMQPDIQNQGYAAGYAAALAVESNVQPRDVNVNVLQQHLVQKDNLTSAVLTHKDSYPFSPGRMEEAVRNVANKYDDIEVILAQPKDALPLLKEAYARSSKETDKLAYAHILGMLGDATGAETLIAAINDADAWDKGWQFKGMGQFGWTLSPLDSRIIALGRTRYKRGVPAIVAKVEKLTAKDVLSHHRAVASALEMMGDPRAAKPLYNLLNRPGIMGHAFLEIEDTVKRTPANRNDVTTRERSLVELVLARALFRCGDHNGLGAKILNMYANDLRGHYARHARAVLAGEPPNEK